jgi:hypothetical protein
VLDNLDLFYMQTNFTSPSSRIGDIILGLDHLGMNPWGALTIGLLRNLAYSFLRALLPSLHLHHLSLMSGRQGHVDIIAVM